MLAVECCKALPEVVSINASGGGALHWGVSGVGWVKAALLHTGLSEGRMWFDT